MNSPQGVWLMFKYQDNFILPIQMFKKNINASFYDSEIKPKSFTKYRNGISKKYWNDRHIDDKTILLLNRAE